MVNTYGAHDRYVRVMGVASHSNPDKEYVVAVTADEKWSCSCPHWIHHMPRPNCKHIVEAKSFVLSAFAPTLKPMSEVVKKALNRFSAIEV